MSKSSDEPLRRVEVITSVQRRRRWSVSEKVRLVEDAMQPGMSVSYVARQAGLSEPDPTYIRSLSKASDSCTNIPLAADTGSRKRDHSD